VILIREEGNTDPSHDEKRPRHASYKSQPKAQVKTAPPSWPHLPSIGDTGRHVCPSQDEKQPYTGCGTQPIVRVYTIGGKDGVRARRFLAIASTRRPASKGIHWRPITGTLLSAGYEGQPRFWGRNCILTPWPCLEARQSMPAVAARRCRATR
jgi:hypothetical protein